LLAVPVADNDVLTVGLGEPAVIPAGDQSASEGTSQLFSLGTLGDFNNSGNYTVTVNWGDGTPKTVFASAVVGTIAPQTHTYAQDGNFPVTITVQDVDGTSTPVGFTANVSNVAPNRTPPAAQSAFSGVNQSFNLGSFSDPGADAPWNIVVN